MERFGLQAGAHILEPSMGVGHFFGMMPEGLYPDTKRTGVELDSVTARIAANSTRIRMSMRRPSKRRSFQKTSLMP